MSHTKQLFKSVSQDYHMFIHLCFGLVAFLFIYINTADTNPLTLLLVSVLGTFLPDMDHFLFMFVYGRSTSYAKTCRTFIKKGQIKSFCDFCKINHKDNTAIYSHNFLSLALVLILTVIFYSYSRFYLSLFFLSWSFHYLFDILEDLYFFGQVNPNWLLRFNKARQ